MVLGDVNLQSSQSAGFLNKVAIPFPNNLVSVTLSLGNVKLQKGDLG